jgi:hypothetical protein
MRYTFLFLIHILVSCSLPKRSPSNKTGSSDLLKQHTYLVFHKSKQGEFFGAGFFLRKGKDLFFMTANHIAAMPVDSVKILLDRFTNSTYTISITEGHSKDLKKSFGEYDLYLKKINNELINKVNVVNRFVPDYKNFDFSKVKKIVYYGFPTTKNEQPNDFKVTFPEYIKSEDTIIGNYNHARFSPTFNTYDSVNYMTKSINGTYSGEGDSGAPVFFEVNKQYYFGGMCTAGVGALRVTYILRPDRLLDSLTKFSKFPNNDLSDK